MSQSDKRIIALIPARLESSRLPRKLLRDLGGKSILRRTCEAVLQSGLFTEVIAVCDDALLVDALSPYGIQTRLSSKTHESGTDRIAEAARDVEADLVINVQADEPFMDAEALRKVIALFDDPLTDVATLKMKLNDPEQIQNPNRVKVVTNADGLALYFSRAAIPFHRDGPAGVGYYQHIGVYGFRKEALLRFASLPPTTLEQTEKLENLRMLEYGFRVRVAEIDHAGISIDTLEDLSRAETYIQQGENR